MIKQAMNNLRLNWLSRYEQIELSMYNETFIKVHPYEEYINLFVNPGNGQYTATQIAEFINTQFPLQAQSMEPQQASAASW